MLVKLSISHPQTLRNSAGFNVLNSISNFKVSTWACESLNLFDYNSKDIVVKNLNVYDTGKLVFYGNDIHFFDKVQEDVIFSSRISPQTTTPVSSTSCRSGILFI